MEVKFVERLIMIAFVEDEEFKYKDANGQLVWELRNKKSKEISISGSAEKHTIVSRAVSLLWKDPWSQVLAKAALGIPAMQGF